MQKLYLQHTQALNNKMQHFNPSIMDFDSDCFEVQSENECPHCHYGIDLSNDSYRSYHDIANNEQSEFTIFAIHLCPHCLKGFVVEHKMKIDTNENFSKIKEISHIQYPVTPKSFAVDNRVKRISKRFCDIYKQSLQAKECRLSEIYGMGLRKSMECLVKDYAVYTSQDTEEKISRKNLAECISCYIQDSDIQTLATSCRKIGNNETHWKNENDISDIRLMEQVMECIITYIANKVTVLDAQNYNQTHK